MSDYDRAVKKVLDEHTTLLTRLEDKEVFKKNDSNKLRWDLIPENVMEEIMRVLNEGAIKYGTFNWYDNADTASWNRLMNSRDRHTRDFNKGIKYDVETGLHQLAHTIANCIFLMSFDLDGRGIDDRKWKLSKEELTKREQAALEIRQRKYGK